MDEMIQILIREFDLPLPISPDTPLISTGIIDSFHMTALLSLLEERYNLRIDPADVGADNFDTPRQIYQFIQASR